MAILRVKEIEKMHKEEIEEKIKELKFEMIKEKANAHKSGKTKIKEIKKTIARLLTLGKLKQLRNK